MERIGDSVRRLRRGDATADAGALAVITRAWPAAVGDAIARAAWPARIARDGTLHVATVSSTWAFELTSLAAEITDRLVTALGPEAPPALRFAPGHVPSPGAPEPGEDVVREQISPTDGDRSAAAALASVIEDEDLRRRVARAAAASLARQRTDRGF